MEDVVTLQHVNKAYKDFALKDISFSVKKGYITGFIGPNGAGKTTTIKLMLNLLEADSGSINVFGHNYLGHVNDIKQRIGFIYADHHLYGHLTIEKMKRVLAPFYKNWDDQVFAEYVERLQLPWTKKIGHLSKGMGTKLSIAIALSHHADLIILDEPTSGLDPISRREILELLTEVIQDEEKTVFFSTHITTDLEQIADYITFIDQGSIVFSESKESITERYYLVRGANELLDKDIRSLFVQVRQTSVGFEGLTNQAELVRRLMEDHVVMERASLEDIMVYTVGKRKEE
ncbi:ABC transporter ATP-binding protein [Alkalicoccobacillus porphyridii]|uniref:ABC transporter ATP-binding protein n=1 Tax=Alkalicoccobacillus porphyridii TaxID=2597270 RepID=A0A554A2I7_9BACI|nr:ABC transporter ATP-binding protein [Alkalicoccobacillus porphyridii]TSB47902.1 ABC transporter ATP-binding protein [Alkalicoccobacillus porphyridii]